MRKSKNNKKMNVEMENQVTEVMVEDLDNSSEVTQEEVLEVENTEKVLDEVTEVEETVTEAVEEAVAEADEAEEVIAEEAVEVVEEVNEECQAAVEETIDEVAEAVDEVAEVAEEVTEASEETETAEEAAEETTEETAEEAVVEEEAETAEKEAKPAKQKKIKMPAFLSKIRIKISHKLLALCMLPMVIIAVAITILSVKALQKGVEQEIQKSLKIVATSVNAIYSNLYEGDYTQDKGGTVKKGEHQISKDYELIDILKE